MPIVNGLTMDTIPIRSTAIARERGDIGEKPRGIIAVAITIITNVQSNHWMGIGVSGPV